MIKSPNQSLNTIHRYVILFLIHAPAKGATLTWIMFLYLKKYFNPRSREGSDLFVAVKVWYPMKISIHAPAKGATINTLRGYTICDISIHAPAKGATKPCKYIPTTRVISIHAPAKGATIPDEFRIVKPGISIHAPAKGATRYNF